MASPVKQTCPDIDKAIRWIEDALRTINDGYRKYEKKSDEYDLLRDIERDIEDVPKMLEELRKANAALREWGEELDSEVESSANYISELEAQIEKLKQGQLTTQ